MAPFREGGRGHGNKAKTELPDWAKEIQTSYTDILLSQDGKPYEETRLNLGEDFKLNYTYKFLPFIILIYIYPETT